MPESLRDLVSQRRRELGLSQEELAQRADMSQEWTSKVERGVIKRPGREPLLRLAAVLGLPAEDLIVAAGIAPTRRAAEAMVRDLGDADRRRLDDIHEAIDGYLLKLDDDDLAALKRYLGIIAAAAELRQSTAPTPPPPPPASSAQTAPTDAGAREG